MFDARSCHINGVKMIPVTNLFGPQQSDIDQWSLVLRKQVFGVSSQVPHKPGCTATIDG